MVRQIDREIGAGCAKYISEVFDHNITIQKIIDDLDQT